MAYVLKYDKQISVDCLVNYKDDSNIQYGKVKSIKNGQVQLHFKKANNPKVCEKCGNTAGLSQSGNTGEIECLMTGCGHGHGFKEWEEIKNIEELVVVEKE